MYGRVVQVDGVLMPPDGPDCWPPSDNRWQWVVFSNLDGMTLRGAGTIEGNSEDWWDLPCKPRRVRPELFWLHSSQPDIMSHLHELHAQTLYAGPERLDAARTVRQPHGTWHCLPPCSAASSPSSIMLLNAAGRGLAYWPVCMPVRVQLLRFFMSWNLVVEGLRVENSPEFHFRFDGCSDVRVDGLYISSPANSPNTDGIHVENTERVGIYNSRISNGNDCISIGTGSYDVDIQNINVTDVSYANVRGSYDARSAPIHFACSDTVPCTNITMSDVELLPFSGELVDYPFCWSA